MALIGYARVSTEEQTTDPQLDELRRAGCTRIHQDVMSGASRARPELRKALAALRPGDTLLVVRLDRLARSLSHLLEVVEDLDRRSVGFRSLNDPIDTTTPQGRFTLQILGAVGELERALIRERTRAGLRSAKAQGRVGGNPGLRRRDPAAIARVTRAREDHRSDMIAAAATDFLPEVRRLRPQGITWDQIVALLRHQGKQRPGGGEWTRDSLIRAVRRLVRDGLAEKALLDPAPRTGAEDEAAPAMVAAIWLSLEKPTLLALARQLERARVRTPRGKTRWSASSVKNLLDRARAEGLVA
ncbi:MAG TPA: recombinase family protein [Azospirillaceae bacterium]|nr:recombinase family protein [Azospirillaceae bacterium]